MKEPLSFGLRWTIRLNAAYAILPAARYIFLTPSQRGTPMFEWDSKYYFALDSIFLLWLCFGLSERRAWARWTALIFYGADALGARCLGFMWSQEGAGWVITDHSYSIFGLLSWLIQITAPPMVLFILAFLLSSGEEFKN